MTMRWLWIFAVLAACAPTTEPPVARATAPGEEVEIEHWANWDSACAAMPFEIEIATAPKHGDTEIRDAVMAIPERDRAGRETGCAGVLVESKKVVYRPAAGFSGDDALVLRLGSAGGDDPVTRRYLLAVR